MPPEFSARASTRSACAAQGRRGCLQRWWGPSKAHPCLLVMHREHIFAGVLGTGSSGEGLAPGDASETQTRAQRAGQDPCRGDHGRMAWTVVDTRDTPASSNNLRETRHWTEEATPGGMVPLLPRQARCASKVSRPCRTSACFDRRLKSEETWSLLHAAECC